MPSHVAKINALPAWNSTAKETYTSACQVKDWEIIEVIEGNFNDQFLYGTILNDYRGRFKLGDYVFTSGILKLDYNTGLVETRNSLYCLVGDGEQLKASAIEAYKMKTIGQSLHIIQGVERDIGPIIRKID